MPPELNSTSSPQDQAAIWFSYLSSGAATDQDIQAFYQWRSQSAEHDRQYRNIERIWQVTLHVPEQELRAMLQPTAPSRTLGNRSRRRFVFGMASLCAAGMVAAIGTQYVFRQAEYEGKLVAQRGERAELQLPDGSILIANTGTQAQVYFDDSERLVTLQSGEIFFDVKHDSQRPFVVQAGTTRVVVTGTRFNVLHEAEQLHVSVESGSVNVQQGPWWSREQRSLRAGQAVRNTQDDRLGVVQTADLNKELAWQRGMIVFENTPLQQAVAEISRYLQQPALLNAPTLKNYRLAGIFSVEDPLALIQTLPELVPVRVQYKQNGQLVISEL